MPRTRAAQPQRVVGVGLSAGGFEPLRQLLGALPVDTGLAVVVLQHLPPSQVGKLATALRSATKLKVVDAVNGHRVAANTVVVVPPRTSASLVKGALVLSVPKSGARPKQPIDSLFTSLADALAERSIGVVLSGTADDGVGGLLAIRKAGGITVAQDPATAQFDEMPRSAIGAGVAELVLSPIQIAEQLAVIAADRNPRPAVIHDRDGTTRLLELLRENSGIDFTSYKRSTIERRLTRSMSRHSIASIADYASYLDDHPDELRSLYEDLLIHVTEFFRDVGTLDVACDRVAENVRSSGPGAPVRVWIPGCSTGEEVYSLAMLLVEKLGEHRPIQLFGTDLSERAIEFARRGKYPASILQQIGAERVARFFLRDEHGYRIRREMRERCVFVRHDLVVDPPFSKLDLVSCRNVLIYLGPELQRRVIPIFHYALNQPGLLLLGRAETIGGFEMFFEVEDAESRLFARKPRPRTTITFPGAGQLGRLAPRQLVEESPRNKLGVQRDVDQLLLARYAPPCVVIDEQLDVLQFRGRTGPYLEQPPGQPQLNVLRLARGEIGPELRLAIQRAQRSGVAVRTRGVRLRERGRTKDRSVDVEVVPVPSNDERGRHFAIMFEEGATRAAPPAAVTKRTRKSAGHGDEINRLHQELDASREYVRSISAQHSAASEELGLVNEELQSTNEELQSTNEELQTAKEELQSTNEELETVNEELQRNNVRLRETNDDLVNVLASIDVAIIIVDTERCIRRFTPKARTVMRLLATDIGRPIEDLATSLPVKNLDGMIKNVVESLGVDETEVRTPDGLAYRMQIRPYRTADERIGGAVLMFIDVSTLRTSIEAERAARSFAVSIVETVPSPLVVIDDTLSIVSVNRAFTIAVPNAAIGRNLLDLGEWRGIDLGVRLVEVFASKTAIADIEVQIKRVDNETRLYAVAATPIQSGERPLVLVALNDVTERSRLEELRLATERQRNSFLAALTDELRTPLSAIMLWADVLRGLEPDDPHRVVAIDTIAECARAESQLVDDLLDLAMSASGELAIEASPIEAEPIVKSAIESVLTSATDRTVNLVAALDGKGSHIWADPRRLRQVVKKLLANAVEFTAAGSDVYISMTQVGRSLELRVADHGPGIDPDFLPLVFEPFAQQDPSRARVHRGLGIGLALVRYLVERQAGSIEVESPEGHGSTFVVRFPITNTRS